ncbi:MAG: T9SS type A sorting domain-containing protein [Rhodothermaceae bacterium]|nr:T9SS type A sorting domain-containing protein [Rhodothermaceae bacterium]MYF40465.1 T9SS type A sorting domain-containing protein [Rhodothermaceae bacterium]
MRQPIPNTPNQIRNRNRLVLWTMTLCICLIWSACLIIEIEMPSTANTGEVIDLRVVAQENVAESSTPWKGVFSVLVPEDWDFVSAEYTASDMNGDVGSGSLVVSPEWTDSTEKAIPAPMGMKWIGTISDVGYLHADTLIAETIMRVQVGQTTGDFGIGYVVTKESYAPTCDWFMNCPGGTGTNGADSSMNNMITVMGTTGIEDVTEKGIPSQFVLEQNYPNPFNPSTTIRYAVEEATSVRLRVFDVGGREVAQLVNETKSPGVYETKFEADNLPSGIYLYRLEAGEFSETRSMILNR